MKLKLGQWFVPKEVTEKNVLINYYYPNSKMLCPLLTISASTFSLLKQKLSPNFHANLRQMILPFIISKRTLLHEDILSPNPKFYPTLKHLISLQIMGTQSDFAEFSHYQTSPCIRCIFVHFCMNGKRDFHANDVKNKQVHDACKA